MALIKTLIIVIMMFGAVLHMISSVGESVKNHPAATAVNGLLCILELAVVYATFAVL